MLHLSCELVLHVSCAAHFAIKFVPAICNNNFELCILFFLGKTVFKKPVKLTVMVMPTQTTQSSGELTAHTAIVFDGRTFTVTFTQTAGTVYTHYVNIVIIL